MKKLLEKRNLIETLKFLVKLNLLSIPVYLITFFDVRFNFLQNFTAFLVFKFLKMVGYSVNWFNNLVLLRKGTYMFDILIDMDCTAWKSYMFLIALSVATPKKNIKKRLGFLIFSLPTLFFLNILRVFSAVVVLYHFSFSEFQIFHTVLWREGLITAVLLLWYLWLKSKI